MKTPLTLALFSFALAAAVFAQRPAPIYPDAAPVLAPEDLRKVALPNTVIESVAVVEAEGAVRITAIVSHPPANDRVKVWVALPLKNWNGRFQGNGGGGFNTGRAESLRGPVALGFATAATDGGHEGGSGSFALHASGRPNWQEIRDFAYLAIHDMAVVGKALTQAFYGKPPRYSYFVGSSTGGRQGLTAAQRYPEDFDGIYSGCPAINWAKFVPSTLWPQVVMFEAQHLVPKAKLDAVTAAVIATHDGDDGVVDGVIDDPLRVSWDPKAFVGTRVGDSAFTEADAAVVRKIWEGPRGAGRRFLWHGLTRGTSLFATAGSDGAPAKAKPFGIGLDWFRYFLALNAGFDGTSLTAAEFELYYNQSAELLAPTFSSDNPDLTRFRDRGGKVIITHGLADQLIPPQGSIDYYERVQRRMGGPEKAAEFARLFLSPGTDHGFRGPGPTPTGTLPALIRWVEEGRAPDRLPGEVRAADGKVLRTRPIFPYPQFAKYSGTGSPDDAANFIAGTRAP